MLGFIGLPLPFSSFLLFWLADSLSWYIPRFSFFFIQTACGIVTAGFLLLRTTVSSTTTPVEGSLSQA